MSRTRRWHTTVLILAICGATVLGYGERQPLLAQEGSCPTAGACYRQNCPQGCTRFACNAELGCPEPGEIGPWCFVCSHVE